MVNYRRRCCLILMVKESRMGAVKTRLACEIGQVAATQFYRTVTANLIRRLVDDPRWRTVLAVTPDRAVASPVWPGSIPRIAQGKGDIGERMERLLMSQALGPAILIGSDIPGVRPRHIAEAFAVLERHDVVFGAAEDGGFWLVGLKPLPQLGGLFRGVRWSSPRALADTLGNLRRRRVGFAATLSDVDNARSFAETKKFGACVTHSWLEP